jgi:hypothetical protein
MILFANLASVKFEHRHEIAAFAWPSDRAHAQALPAVGDDRGAKCRATRTGYFAVLLLAAVRLAATTNRGLDLGV